MRAGIASNEANSVYLLYNGKLWQEPKDPITMTNFAGMQFRFRVAFFGLFRKSDFLALHR